MLVFPVFWVNAPVPHAGIGFPALQCHNTARNRKEAAYWLFAAVASQGDFQGARVRRTAPGAGFVRHMAIRRRAVAGRAGERLRGPPQIVQTWRSWVGHR